MYDHDKPSSQPVSAPKEMFRKSKDHVSDDGAILFGFDIVRITTSLLLSMAQNGDSCQNSETTVPDCGGGEVYLRFYRMVLCRI